MVVVGAGGSWQVRCQLCSEHFCPDQFRQNGKSRNHGGPRFVDYDIVFHGVFEGRGTTRGWCPFREWRGFTRRWNPFKEPNLSRGKGWGAARWRGPVVASSRVRGGGAHWDVSLCQFQRKGTGQLGGGVGERELPAPPCPRIGSRCFAGAGYQRSSRLGSHRSWR